jgi:hypothetical protein
LAVIINTCTHQKIKESNKLKFSSAAARDGANLVIAAKTADPHPRLEGTIFSAAKESWFITSLPTPSLLYYDLPYS